MADGSVGRKAGDDRGGIHEPAQGQASRQTSGTRLRYPSNNTWFGVWPRRHRKHPAASCPCGGLHSTTRRTAWLLLPGPAMWGICWHGVGVMHGIVAVGGGGACDEVRGGWFWVVVAGFLGGGVGVGGGVAVGAWWVYCFLSRREGDQRKCWEPEAANPLNFKTGSGRRFVRSGFGWGGLDGLRVAETLICKAVRTRVSLKSCSGAILDCLLVVVVPGVSVV